MLYDVSRIKAYFELSVQIIERMNTLKDGLDLPDDKKQELNDLIKELLSVNNQAQMSVKYYSSAEQSRMELISSVKLS